MKKAYYAHPITLYGSIIEKEDVQLIEKIGFEVVKPLGAFYIMPSTESFNINGDTFSREIMKEQAVAIVPGSIFGSYSDNMIRISYATEISKLEESMNRIDKFVKKSA